jgi:hypothetical protein
MLVGPNRVIGLPEHGVAKHSLNHQACEHRLSAHAPRNLQQHRVRRSHWHIREHRAARLTGVSRPRNLDHARKEEEPALLLAIASYISLQITVIDNRHV